MITKMEEEFDQWCSQLKLAQNTRCLIAQVRQVPPSGRVQGNSWTSFRR